MLNTMMENVRAYTCTYFTHLVL